MSETHMQQKIDLDALEAALAKASLPYTMRILSATISLHPQGPDMCSNDEQEAYFILAHKTLPALIAELRELRAEVARLREDAAREHEEFGTADTLEAAQAAAVAWVDEQEGK